MTHTMTDTSPNPPSTGREPGPFAHAMRTGVRMGVFLSVIMIAALVVANRVTALEGYALERNALFLTAFVLVAVSPVLRFRKRPRQMFVAAMVGWVLFVGAYDLAGRYFRDLFDALQHTPFETLVEGAVVYGICAVGSWVMEMIHHARRQPIVSRRKPPTP